MSAAPSPRYGVVAIGRNEGERLRRCLQSIGPARVPVVYVDSGSTDGSAAMAQGMGAHVVALDMSCPFTAARARNEGFRHLAALRPGLEFVKFVDGDCEVQPSWIATAIAFLDAHPQVAGVSGQRRERFPERSIYNRLCDLDWHWRAGETRSFGGDVVLRTAAFQAVGGYDDHLIAGEEPELCVRLRRAGWKIWQLDEPMTLHDVDMHRFSQWWRRSMRTGFAYAEGASMHGAPPERHWVRETRSAAFWGVMLPAASLLALPLSYGVSALLLVVYPVQVVRIARHTGLPRRLGLLKAVFTVIGKFAEGAGVVKFAVQRLQGRQARLIEYK